ncbi:hypothetical protein ACFCXS_33810 [Streptomyces sp. NPDC056373]|uniref:hypothetical protein n=1 Tax=Streptomyces sp. NPDC056373 TaxID=3345798 RepID=UPI0035D9DE85
MTALLLATLTACGGTEAHADPQACKKALYDQNRDSVAAGDDATPSKKPAACDGIDDKTLQRLAGEAIREYLASDDAQQAVDDAVEGAIDDAPWEDVTPTPAASDLGKEFNDAKRKLDDLTKETGDAATP